MVYISVIYQETFRKKLISLSRIRKNIDDTLYVAAFRKGRDIIKAVRSAQDPTIFYAPILDATEYWVLFAAMNNNIVAIDIEKFPPNYSNGEIENIFNESLEKWKNPTPSDLRNIMLRYE